MKAVTATRSLLVRRSSAARRAAHAFPLAKIATAVTNVAFSVLICIRSAVSVGLIASPSALDSIFVVDHIPDSRLASDAGRLDRGTAPSDRI
jgi:hypothetical protein